MNKRVHTYPHGANLGLSWPARLADIQCGAWGTLDESMRRIGRKLGFEHRGAARRLNTTVRDQKAPAGFRERFMELNPLEFEVYRYCRERFDGSG